MKTRLGRVETRLDRVEKGLEGLNGTFQAFVKNVPDMMRDVMREVLQERDTKP